MYPAEFTNYQTWKPEAGYKVFFILNLELIRVRNAVAVKVTVVFACSIIVEFQDMDICVNVAKLPLTSGHSLYFRTWRAKVAEMTATKAVAGNCREAENAVRPWSAD